MSKKISYFILILPFLFFQNCGSFDSEVFDVDTAEEGDLDISKAALDSGTPEFPIKNIDTRVVKKENGKYNPTTSHLPMTEFSLDGRIGLLRKNGPGGSAQLFPLKPKRVFKHFKHEANPIMGANLIDQNYHIRYYPNSAFPTQYKNQHIGRNLNPARTILCEKTEEQANPYPCGSGRDCYNVTFITRYQRMVTVSGKEMKEVRLAASTARLTVANPKTNSARIERIDYMPSTRKVGPLHRYPKMAEPVVVGDGRLFITRVHNAQVTLSNGRPTQPNINIVYSVYPDHFPQCDVTQWKQFHPISHAYEDSRMNPKYKFARYPMRDSLGNRIPGDHDFGGSYPWMDKDAANLFFTAMGTDTFYNRNSSGVKMPFPEAPASASYFTPAIDNYLDQSFVQEAKYVEARGARTSGISMAGFWTHGKTVVFDGNLNNVDYNFTVANRVVNGDTINAARKLKLYNRTPAGQFYESVGSNREIGGNEIGSEAQRYNSLMSINSTFLGSIENRLNYSSSMKPATARDVVWLFGSTRHTEELAFDDYISPYFLINAEMTAPVGFKSSYRLGFGAQYMRHFSGFISGVPQSSSFSGDPRNAGAPALVQNSATAPDAFMKVPRYGKLSGSARIEPIAKGGIQGKGLWLEPNSAVTFAIPGQSGTNFNLAQQKHWYLGAFIDSRSQIPVNETRQFISWGNRFSLRLRKLISGNHQYDRLVLYDYNTAIAHRPLPTNLRVKYKQWRHIGVQFSRDFLPVVFINGMQLGQFNLNTGVTSNRVRSAFQISGGDDITLGYNGGGTQGVRGWVDDFKVIARIPHWEEKCNYARGTMIELNASNTYWQSFVDSYPSSVQADLRNQLGEGNPNTKYACYTRYNGGIPAGQRMAQDNHANLKNQPAGTRSIRDSLLGTKNALVFDSPRPDFSHNNFCLSCHVSPSMNSNKELNSRALAKFSSVKMQFDSRRQPMQPDKFIRGVIPANMFGNGKPSRTIASTGSRIDQWVNPKYTRIHVQWNRPASHYEYSLDVKSGGQTIAPCVHAGILKTSGAYSFTGRCANGQTVPLDARTKVRICNVPHGRWGVGKAGCSPYKKISEHDNGVLKIFAKPK